MAELTVSSRCGLNSAALYDYIYGGVANDRIFDTINLYMAGLMDRIPSSLLIFKISPSEALHLFYGSKICADLHYKQTGLYLYGDFEQWIVRYIQESPIIGGQCKTIYAIGKTDTIRNNIPYVNPIQDNVWCHVLKKVYPNGMILIIDAMTMCQNNTYLYLI